MYVYRYINIYMYICIYLNICIYVCMSLEPLKLLPPRSAAEAILNESV